MSRKLQYLCAVALPAAILTQGLLPRVAHAQAAAPAPAPAAASDNQVQEVVVTARRKQESIQSVPIAVTALSGADLKARQLKSGADLEQSAPNMTFSRASFGSVDYQIRGIGYQVVSTAADAGVGVDENNVPLVVNRLADADFYDVQRVEVLRGPQGTL